MESPVDKGYSYATLAEEYAAKQDFEKAIHYHFLSSEHFLEATEYTTDLEVSPRVSHHKKAIKTLKSLHVAHASQGKQLQRRLKQAQERVSRQTSLTQLQETPVAPISLHASVPPSFRPPVHLHTQPSPVTMERLPSSELGMMGSRQYFLGQSQSESVMSMIAKPLQRQSGGSSGPALMTVTSLDESQSHAPSQSMDTSYFMLHSNTRDIPQDLNAQDDPFVRFWDKVENLVDQFTSPVPPNIPFAQPNTHFQSPIQRAGQDSFMEKNHAISQSYFVVPSGHLAESRLPLAPSTLTRMNSSKSLSEYEIENKQLKETIDILAKRVSVLEKTATENSILKNSIYQFREDMVKQRMQSRTPVKNSSELELMHSDPKALVQKILELETQLGQTQKELEKQTLVVEKYKEKWDKLKESSRRKKDQRSDSLTQKDALETPIELDESTLESSTCPASSAMYYSTTAHQEEP